MKKFTIKIELLDDELTSKQIIDYINKLFCDSEITTLMVIGDGDLKRAINDNL